MSNPQRALCPRGFNISLHGSIWGSSQFISAFFLKEFIQLIFIKSARNDHEIHVSAIPAGLYSRSKPF